MSISTNVNGSAGWCHTPVLILLTSFVLVGVADQDCFGVFFPLRSDQNSGQRSASQQPVKHVLSQSGRLCVINITGFYRSSAEYRMFSDDIYIFERCDWDIFSWHKSTFKKVRPLPYSCFLHVEYDVICYKICNCCFLIASYTLVF